MNKAYIVAFLVISIAIGFTLWAFNGSMTPYVNIKVARVSDITVQVRGKIMRDVEHAPVYDKAKNRLGFWIVDDGKVPLQVVYHGATPDSFDTAPETAAHGMMRGGVFESDQLIVKCPTKYDDNKSPYKSAKAAEGKS